MPAQRLPTDVRAAIATLVDFVDGDLERYTLVLGSSMCICLSSCRDNYTSKFPIRVTPRQTFDLRTINHTYTTEHEQRQLQSTIKPTFSSNTIAQDNRRSAVVVPVLSRGIDLERCREI